MQKIKCVFSRTSNILLIKVGDVFNLSASFESEVPPGFCSAKKVRTLEIVSLVFVLKDCAEKTSFFYHPVNHAEYSFIHVYLVYTQSKGKSSARQKILPLFFNWLRRLSNNYLNHLRIAFAHIKSDSSCIQHFDSPP